MGKSMLLVCWAVLATWQAAAAETVRLAIGDWAPYTSESDPHGKVLEKVVAAAFKLEGLDVTFAYFPWKRSYLLVENGEFDGTFPWNRTAEREKTFAIHELSLIKDEGVYFHLTSTPFDWKVVEDLRRYRVGVTLGYKQEDEYRKKGIAAETVPSEELNFRKMLRGRIDVYQTSRDVGYATIAKQFTPAEARRFTHHPKIVEQSEYFILFSKKTAHGQALARRFDAGMVKLKQSGAYDQIIGAYRAGAK